VGGEGRRDGWLDKEGEEGWGYFLLATAKFAIFFQIFYAEPRRGEAYEASEGSSEKFAPLLCDTRV
jgi:hypothetical protein